MNENLILVVDDEPEICGEISGFLSAKGYQVMIAHNGKDAVKMFNQHGPVLILSDYKMPVMNGIDLLKVIKGINKDIHVVLISGAADGKTIVEGMREHAFDFLLKPIDLNQLLDICKTAIEKTLLNRKHDTMRRDSGGLISDVSHIEDHITLLYFSGDLDEYNTTRYENYIKKLFDEKIAKKNIVFMLKNVKYINNIGLNFLIAVNDSIQQKGHYLHLCGLSQHIEFYLRSLGYLNYFNIHNSIEILKERIHLEQ
jgi:anti-anti-sigma factor